MSGQRTPGPWFINGRDLVECASGAVAGVLNPADARLIAAAPEMLTELQNASWLLAELSPDGLVKKQIDAVIAKATKS